MLEIKKRSTGYVDPRYYKEKAKLEKNAKKGHCIICGKKLPKGKRKYCKDECFQNWFKQFNPPFLWNEIRRKVLRRDKYRCVECGTKEKGGYPKSNLVVDHIKPIALGGNEWDMKNLQTLCEKCNRKKTKQDLRDIAQLRREIKNDKIKTKELEEKIKMEARWGRWILRTK